jgi:competence protein ComEC
MQASEGEAGLISSAIAELRGRPLACAVAMFAVGIWVGASYEIRAAWALGAAAAVALAIVAATVRRSRAAAALVLLLAALVGGFAYSVSQIKRAGDVSTLTGTAGTFEGIVVGDPRPWGDRQAMAVNLQCRVGPSSAERTPARGRVWLTCVSRVSLERGDRVRFTAVIHPPRVATNPGEVTRAPALQAAGLSALAYVTDERLLERLGAAELGPLERAGIAVREHVSRVMRESMPGPYPEALGALLGSIVFGAKAHPLPPEVMDAFRRAGVVHVLVVSGTQISLLFTIVYAPGAVALYYRRRRYGAHVGAWGRLAPAPAHASLALALTLIALYALFTEGGRPVARAAVMGGMVAFGLILRQTPAVADHHALEFDRYTMLAVAALALLVVRPAALFDIGLQLSLAAVAGIVGLAPTMMRLLRPLPGWLAATVGATTAAQLAVLPVTAWHFRYISPVGFVANLFVIPAAALLLATGIAVAVLGSISMPLATAVNYLNAPLLRVGVGLVYAVSNLPGATIRAEVTSAWLVAAYCAALVGAAALAHRWLGRRHPDQEPMLQ